MPTVGDLDDLVNKGLERIYQALDEFARQHQMEDEDTIYYLQRNWAPRDVDLAEGYKEWIGAMD